MNSVIILGALLVMVLARPEKYDSNIADVGEVTVTKIDSPDVPGLTGQTTVIKKVNPDGSTLGSHTSIYTSSTDDGAGGFVSSFTSLSSNNSFGLQGSPSFNTNGGSSLGGLTFANRIGGNIGGFFSFTNGGSVNGNDGVTALNDSNDNETFSGPTVTITKTGNNSVSILTQTSKNFSLSGDSGFSHVISFSSRGGYTENSKDSSNDTNLKDIGSEAGDYNTAIESSSLSTSSFPFSLNPGNLESNQFSNIPSYPFSNLNIDPYFNRMNVGNMPIFGYNKFIGPIPEPSISNIDNVTVLPNDGKENIDSTNTNVKSVSSLSNNDNNNEMLGSPNVTKSNTNISEVNFDVRSNFGSDESPSYSTYGNKYAGNYGFNTSGGLGSQTNYVDILTSNNESGIGFNGLFKSSINEPKTNKTSELYLSIKNGGNSIVPNILSSFTKTSQNDTSKNVIFTNTNSVDNFVPNLETSTSKYKSSFGEIIYNKGKDDSFITTSTKKPFLLSEFINGTTTESGTIANLGASVGSVFGSTGRKIGATLGSIADTAVNAISDFSNKMVEKSSELI